MWSALLVILCLAPPPPTEPGPAPEPTAPPETPPCHVLGPKERVRIDLDDVPLGTFARMVSCALDRNILIDPPTLGDKRVSVIGPTPIDRSELDRLWQAVLLQHGLVTERHGAFDVVRVPP